MTDDELKAIEAEADGDCSNCFALVAEVRRLRGLLEQTERERGQWRLKYFKSHALCEDCGIEGPLAPHPDHHGDEKLVCRDRAACNKRNPR